MAIQSGYSKKAAENYEDIFGPNYCDHVREVSTSEPGKTVQFFCTQPKGHTGKHIAHGPDDVEIISWEA